MLHVNGRSKLLFSEQWWISAPTRGRRELKQAVEELISQVNDDRAGLYLVDFKENTSDLFFWNLLIETLIGTHEEESEEMRSSDVFVY